MSPRRRAGAYPGELERPVDIQLRTFPSADPSFHAFACEALDAMKRPSTRGLQDTIRSRYPLAVVRSQETLARRGAGPLVWYAFRYGSVAHGPPGMPLIDWEGRDIAWAILDAERRFVDVNDALVAIVEQPRDVIVGRAIDEFTNPEDPTIREDIAVLWQQFVDTRWAESTIRFNRRDGRRRQFAYRIVADDPEPGRHRLRVSEIDPTPGEGRR
jgi:PAS domain-containing protein